MSPPFLPQATGKDDAERQSAAETNSTEPSTARNFLTNYSNNSGHDKSHDNQKPTQPSEAAPQPADDEQGQIARIVGDFGRFQFLIFLFKILIGVTSAFNNLGVAFYAPTAFVSHWCADSTNSTIANYNKYNNYQSPATIISDFLFNEWRSERHSSPSFSYQTPASSSIRHQCVHSTSNQTCSQFAYDTGIWKSTIIDEFGLVCDKTWLVSLSQALYMSGFIASYLVFGYLSDRYGRWRTLFAGGLIEILSGLGCAFASSIETFLVFRFLLGLGNAARSSASYLLMIECVGPRWRMSISTLGSIGWTVGYCLMPWIQLYFLHFRHMQLFVCLYEFVFVLCMFLVPESPRWLLTRRKYDAAYKVLLTMARCNGLIDDKRSASLASSSSSFCSSNSVDSETSDSTLVIIQPQAQQPSPIDAASLKRSRTESSSQSNVNCQLAVKTKNEVIEITKRLSSGGTAAAAASNSPDKRQNPRKASQVPAIKPRPPVDDEINCMKMFDRHIEPCSEFEFGAKYARLVEQTNSKQFTKNENKLNILHLFKMRNLRNYSLILYLAWMADSFIYYGLALSVGEFGGGKNLFIDFSIAGLFEIPSIAFTILCMKTMPRRKTNLFIFTSTGLLCATLAPLKYYKILAPQLITALFAKLFISCAFTAILYQTIELYPTSLRHTAYSSCSLAGRIGSILAPFIKELSAKTHPVVPSLIYTVLAFLVAGLIVRLPETKGSDLPDTILEAENFKATAKKRRQRLASTASQVSNVDVLVK